MSNVISNNCVCGCVAEKAGSVYGAPVRFEDGEAVDLNTHMKAQTKIRLIRAGIARCVLFFMPGFQKLVISAGDFCPMCKSSVSRKGVM